MSLSYAGLGFVVAKFGLDSSHARLAESGYGCKTQLW